MKVSVIVPVYNVYDYLEKCLDSLANQTLKEMEVIIVNDGTPDNSMQMVESFRKVIPQLKIINQENQGLSGARNTGLKNAKGRYVWFVDSDDTITSNAFNSILEVISISHPDIIGFSVNKIYENSGETNIEPCLFKHANRSFLNEELSGVLLHDKIHNGMVQRYVFSRLFIQDNNLEFYPSIYFEDTEFLVRAKFLAKKIIIKEEVIYNYFIGHNGSIMNSYKIKHLQDDLIIIDNIIKFRDTHMEIPKCEYLMNGIIFKEIFWILSQNEKTINGYNEWFAHSKSKLIKSAIQCGIHSSFPLTLGKLKMMLRVICLLLTK